MHLMVLEMYFIAFLDFKNIDIDIKSWLPGHLQLILGKFFFFFFGGHLNLCIFGGNHWTDFLVLAIF